MKTTLKRLWKIALLACYSACLWAQNSGYWCDRVSVRVEPSELPVRIEHLSFASQGIESYAGLTVVNTEKKGVRDYLILIELFNKEGKYLLTMPFFTESAETGETPFPIAFNRWLYGHSHSIVSPLEPLAEEVIFGDSPVVTFSCPASARITLADFRYVDGTVASYAPHKLTLDPIIAWAPISTPSLSQWLPTFLRAKLAVDSNGNASLTDLDPKSPELFGVLSKEVAGWIVSPPLVNGERSSADLTSLIYIEDVGRNGTMTPVPPEFPQQMSLLKNAGVPALIAIHAYRATPRAKRWIVVAGSHWVETLDERQR
jgi:hypothetical protein